MIEFILSAPVMWTFGLLTHYAFVLMDMSATRKKPVTPWRLVKERYYKVFISLMGALVGYAVLQEQLSDVKIPSYMYFIVGYWANDNIDKAVSIVSKSLPQMVIVQNEKGEPEKIRQDDKTIMNFKDGQEK